MRKPIPAPKRSEDLTQVVEWKEGIARRVEDALAGEEPLEIRIGRRAISVTMRMPGHDEELAAGFLYTEGVVEKPEQIVSLTGVRGQENVIRARLAADAEFDAKRSAPEFFRELKLRIVWQSDD